jgi:ketosteroid isomerase-like protein
MKSMLLIGAFIAASAFAATAGPQADKALQDAADARSKAMTSGDADGWGKYTTDDFIVIEADGTIKTKAQRLAEIKATPNPPSNPTDQKVRMYGPATAVTTAQITYQGKPARVTSVWVQQQGQWKVASVQLTAIAPAK